MSERQTVWLLDAHYQIFRVYYSMPDLRAPDGTPVGAFRGYTGVLIKFLREHGLSKPIVMRMTGNMWQEGLRLFEEAEAESPDLFESVKIYGIETPIEHVVKEAVEAAEAAN